MSKSVFTLSDGAAFVPEPSKEELEQEAAEKFSINDFVKELGEDLVANRLALPTLPALSIEALLVINDVDSSAKDLTKVIEKDAAITARLIRYANCPLYRGRDPIKAIKLAVTRIGFQKVKNAIYAVSMKEVFSTHISVIQKRMEVLWAHSVKVGALASTLAKEQPGLEPEVALVAGLTHDVGKIPLLIKATQHEELAENPAYLDKVLRKVHPGLGGKILKFWKFDPQLVAVAAEHDNLLRNPGDAPVDYVDLVQVANVLAYEGTAHPMATVDRSRIPAFARLGFSYDEQGQAKNEAHADGVEAVFF